MSVDLKKFNEYLADKSYVQGFEPSQADAVLFEAVNHTADDSFANHAMFGNVIRWYHHIASYTALEIKSFPGKKKSVGEYIPGAALAAGKAAAPAAKTAAPAAKAQETNDDEDDMDLFGSDSEDDAANEKLKAERVAAYNEKKSAKPKTIAKSIIIFDVKPWDDETDLEVMKEKVLSIAMDGLVWGTAKFVPIGYGIRKLNITCVVEDDKVGTDDLTDQIMAFEDFVQSVDVVSFNKL